jgi:spore coat polysaccharide biosynthesis protein SpsF
MKIVGIVQARMSSTRLPGKVLLKAAGRPLILHMLERVGRSKLIHDLWLATSGDVSDDPLSDTVIRAGHRVYRGSLENVLSRFWEIGNKTQADAIVRLTGDCPLHDPSVIDDVVLHYLENPAAYDYVSNVMPPTYPDGLDVELLTFSALDEAHRRAKTPFELEHVTPFIRKRAEKSRRAANVSGPADFSHLRWTLDEMEDYQFIKEALEALYEKNKGFTWLDLLAWVTSDSKKLEINSKYHRNQGTRDEGTLFTQGES